MIWHTNGHLGECFVFGNILKDGFEEIWDNHPLLWKLRARENLEDYLMMGNELAAEVARTNICVEDVGQELTVTSMEMFRRWILGAYIISLCG